MPADPTTTFHGTQSDSPNAVRLCAVDREDRRQLCCIAGDGILSPVGEFGDLLGLLAEMEPGTPIAQAVTTAGVGAPIGHIDDMIRTLRTPITPSEVWAAGVTYERSREARTRETELTDDVYERVYRSARPEIFFKATGARVVGPNGRVGLRSDSSWSVPEMELALVLSRGGDVLGFMLANDLTSRDIEAANPLYLPQAKIFAGSCALGPIIASPDAVGDPYDITLRLVVRRSGTAVVDETVSTSSLARRFEDLIDHLRRDNPIDPGTVLLTGTGLVPDDAFALRPGDVIEISAPGLGLLRNVCCDAQDLIDTAGLHGEHHIAG